MAASVVKTQQLPIPSPELIAHSEQLIHIIHEEIKKNGPIPFAHYMQLALYAPHWGYYRSGLSKIGAQGDFVTAPEISPLFSQCIARQCAQVLNKLQHGVILELGAGTGCMALELLRELRRLKILPERYFILEVSGDLRCRQQQLFAEQDPELLKRVEWLDTLPSQPIQGIIIGNEVLDAMPVHKFHFSSSGIKEYYVDYQHEHFVWCLDKPSTPRLIQGIQALQVDFPENYESEINLLLTPWIASLSDLLQQGLLLLIDYGFPRHEYYHPQRSQGTIMCHFQHRAHSNPLIYTGIQDITAHVDFTAIAEAAADNGFDVIGFINQAGFLMNCGIQELLGEDRDEITHYRCAQQIKRLMMESEMGELFKVIACTKNYHDPLLGFATMNQLKRL